MIISRFMILTIITRIMYINKVKQTVDNTTPREEVEIIKNNCVHHYTYGS